MWKTIQRKSDSGRPVQLILDMKVQWSSTYLMLDRAERKKACIDAFVDKLRWEEQDSAKHDKIRELKLTSEEWAHVNKFLGLLSHADNAQQAFSSENVPTLNLAIPALEALHKAWSTRAERPPNRPFAPALHATCNKIDEYYKKTTESPVYIMSMSTWAPAQSRMGKKLNALIWDSELSDEESLQEIGLNVPDDPQRPWLRDYCAYMDVPEQDLPDGWMPVQWWGEAAVGGESSEESDIEDASWDGFIIDNQDLDDEAMYESNYDYN
ncbi:hypothetical protein DFH94DRAFT_811464 [Russula ochroleuca]|uniref:HAT C-terminal dimerisation domain-containing protein n=1 Tax=Russula ochroleuca TaxID=152965 RepID=A0A9P5MPD8_9AGAM|nr:hypothetical protein DFH94DRAFT_811464 [Russula ochroleuca]